MIKLKRIEVTKMNDLGKFLTSQEIIIVYIIAALACLICFIVYLIEKNNENIRRKHNTKKLNKLVDEIRNTLSTEEKQETYSATVDIPVISSEPILINTIDVDETVDLAPVVEEVQKIEGLEEELEYTSIEPDQETARIELQKMQEQLEKDEQLEPVDVVNAYEEEQEKTAIISLDELLKKSDDLYMANEDIQYDDGNEPISLDEVLNLYNRDNNEVSVPTIMEDIVHDEKELYSRKESVPFISSIYGLENNEMAFENTANYEKFNKAENKDFMQRLKEMSENK
jgi:hypothetical protein